MIKKLLLIFAVIGALGFATVPAKAGVHVFIGVGGPAYYPGGYYYNPYYYGAYPAYGVYFGPGYYPWYHGYWGGGYYRGGYHGYYGHGGYYGHHH